MKRKRLKKVLFISSAIIILSLVIFLRGPYISNVLKDAILPELESASGQKVTAEKIFINLFPLYIEAKDLKAFDQSGNYILAAKKVKGYLDLTEIFSRRLSIHRLAVIDPLISTDREQLEMIIRNVLAYLEKERKPALKVKLKVIEVVKGTVHFKDSALKSDFDIKGLGGEFITGENQRLMASIKELTLIKENWPKIVCDLNTAAVFKKDRIEIKRFEIGSYGSKLKAGGFYSMGEGTLKAEIDLIVKTVKRIFNLKGKDEGRISAKGEIRLERDETRIQKLKSVSGGFPLRGPQDIFVDLKLNGDFYLQTLMELLKVKEKLEGIVDFQGSITGRLTDISGKARAKLRNGNLFDVDIDSLACDISYRNGMMKFDNGSASLYNGTAQAEAAINLPVVNFFTLNVKFHQTDSGPALKLIGWDPGIPPGKVDGELSTSGREFSPDGWFNYASLSPEQRMKIKGYRAPVDNVLNRIKTIQGKYSLKSDILSLSNLQVNTPTSQIYADGTVNLKDKILNLKSRLSSENVSDLALPYYREIRGRVDFSGAVSGAFENPKISGRAVMSNILIEGYKSDSATSEFSYERKFLDIHESVIRSAGEEGVIKGRISFPEAKELFDLSKPVYNLSASIKNAEFGQFVRIFYRDFDAKGRLSGDFKIEGGDKDFSVSGIVSAENALAYGVPFDSASSSLTYKTGELSLKKLRIVKSKSILNGEARFLSDNRFSFRAQSEKIYARDVGLDRMPEDAVLSLQSEGQGTFDNPSVTVNAKIAGGTFKGKNMGTGTVSASIQNKNIVFNAALFNERMKLKGSAYLDNTLPWRADLTIQPGRYDFLVSSFLKEVPEDLQLNLEGRAEMKGDKKNITASADINHIALSLFGQTFSNESPVSLLVNNKKLSFHAFTVKSDSTSFRLQGGLEVGKEFDLHLKGSSSLAPLKALSKKISYLKGDSDFEISITGKWDKPEMRGHMNVSNGSFGLKDVPNYMSSINGYLEIEGDKVILQKLSGKFGGGDVKLSGVVYLQAFLIKRFYLEANLDNITTFVSKDFSINYDGSLIFKGTVEAMSITGDMKINRARYKERVEWRSWLLKAKAIEKPKTEGSVFERAALNIRVSGSENISIDNNIARTPVKIGGEMIVRGTISSPILFGRLESSEGYIYFRNNEFKIIFASVDFADPNRIKPVINLTAETTIQGYTIRLNLDGQMDRFTLSMSSEPHLEETDILSLLAVGQVGTQVKGKGLEGGLGAGEATSFITGKYQDVLQERLRSITGLEKFEVEPAVSNITGTVGSRVTVSKRLIGERLFVTYSNFIGATEEQVIKLEYLLEKNVSLVGVRDERGTLGGDVRFRFEFK